VSSSVSDVEQQTGVTASYRDRVPSVAKSHLGMFSLFINCYSSSEAIVVADDTILSLVPSDVQPVTKLVMT